VQIRKSRTLLLHFETRPALDLGEMLRGTLSFHAQDRPVATSMLTGKSRLLHDVEVRFFCQLSSLDWIPSESAMERYDMESAAIGDFLELGFLIGDSQDSAIRLLREREERFAAMEWDAYAFCYHMMNRTKDTDAFENLKGPNSIEGIEQKETANDTPDYYGMMSYLSNQLRSTAFHLGPAPTHFFEVPNAIERRTIPSPKHDGPLFRLLRKRKTVRLFDSQNPMTEEELSTVLYFTLGCQGIAPLTEGVTALRKTSPSGGALHPIEAYPLVLNVTGWTPGLYHYNVQHHRMDLLRNLDSAEAERLAVIFTAGQSYFATAPVLFILTARFQRNFWKYRRAPRSFRVIQLDAGHLSQTLSLVCTELGLGAFFTAAINDINIEEILGIDAVEEGVVGVMGCGHPVSSYALSLETLPYVPGEQLP